VAQLLLQTWPPIFLPLRWPIRGKEARAAASDQFPVPRGVQGKQRWDRRHKAFRCQPQSVAFAKRINRGSANRLTESAGLANYPTVEQTCCMGLEWSFEPCLLPDLQAMGNEFGQQRIVRRS